VAGKDDILSGIVDIVESEIDLPTPGAAWKAALRTTAISAHDILERHPWATEVATRRDLGDSFGGSVAVLSMPGAS